MHVKGSYTVENAVLIPVFTLIIVALLFMAGYLHDQIIVSNAMWNAAVRLEQKQQPSLSPELCAQAETAAERYIQTYSLFVRQPEVTIEEQGDGTIYVKGEVQQGRTLLTAGADTLLSKEIKIPKQNPACFIRKVRAAEKITGGQ